MEKVLKEYGVSIKTQKKVFHESGNVEHNLSTVVSSMHVDVDFADVTEAEFENWKGKKLIIRLVEVSDDDGTG